MLACWRMGAVAAALQHRSCALTTSSCGSGRRPRRSPSARRRCSPSCRGASPAMTLAEVAEVHGRGPPPGDPGRDRRNGRLRSRPDRLHLRDDRRARGASSTPTATCSATAPRPSTGSGAATGELAWCTTATGWSKSARNVFLAPWLTGAAAVLHDGRFDPGERLDLVESLGVDVLCQAPTEYRMLAKRASLRPLPALRRMVSAGEPLNPEVIGAFREATGLEICRRLRPDRDRAADRQPRRRAGPRGLDGPAPAGLRDPGRRRRAAAPRRLLPDLLLPLPGRRARFDGEWWRTGDLVRADEQGYLFFEGRDDDIILSSGYRIGPFEVESALLSHPRVAEAAAVAAPGPGARLGGPRRRRPARRAPVRASSRASCRSTASARPPPTSSPASSSSPTSCRRQRAARSSEPSSGRRGTFEAPYRQLKGPTSGRCRGGSG